MGEILNQFFQSLIAIILGMSSIEFVPNGKVSAQNTQLSAFELYDKRNRPIFVATANQKGSIASLCKKTKNKANKFKKISFKLAQ